MFPSTNLILILFILISHTFFLLLSLFPPYKNFLTTWITFNHNNILTHRFSTIAIILCIIFSTAWQSNSFRNIIIQFTIDIFSQTFFLLKNNEINFLCYLFKGTININIFYLSFFLLLLFSRIFFFKNCCTLLNWFTHCFNVTFNLILRNSIQLSFHLFGIN